MNTLQHEPLAPLGGTKQSGIGRERGAWGMEAFLKAQTLVVG
ncbi:aldehyde dehydrogenase family protein [Stenotrophomonas cyclobalanopsidis]